MDPNVSQSMGSKNASEHPTLLVLWGAMLMSLFVYVAIGLFVFPQRKTPPVDPKMIEVMQIALGALSLISTLAIFGLLPRLAKKAGYLVFCTLRWAFTESIGIFGLVLFFLGCSQTVFFTFAVWSILLMLLLFPSDSDRKRFERLQH